MNEQDLLAERFETHRPRLRAAAYQMLGSLSEADDAVQESWLRLSRSDVSGVQNLGGWLATVVSRICLDILRSRRSRSEDPLDVYLLDPIVEPADGTDPEHQGLILHSVYHRPNGWDAIPAGRSVPCGESSMWGDFHALEAALYLQRVIQGQPYLTFWGWS